MNRRSHSMKGQVTVELLLILPVFMLMIFYIMELGNIAYQTILANHAAYELARIGSLVAGPGMEDFGRVRSDDIDESEAEREMTRVMKEHMFRGQLSDLLEVRAKKEKTLDDPQSLQKNYDLIVTLKYPIKLIFPVVSSNHENFPYLGLANDNNGIRNITVTMRMPVEKPIWK
ncbi:MAG: TadE family protein [bacterium]